MRDIIVNDESYTQLGEFYLNICSELEDGIATYINIMNSVPDAAMKGSAAQEVKALADTAAAFRGVISDIGECMSLQAANYLSSIDAADEYLYN